MSTLFFLFLAVAEAQSFGRLGPHGLYGNQLANADDWIAVVGDSGVTGAASSADIEPTVGNLLGHLMGFLTEARDGTHLPPLSEFPNPEKFGITKIEPLTRVPYSRAEYKATGKFQVPFLNAGAKLSLRLDTHEHAFGYMVGRGLGIPARDIVLVGQDGVMVETIAAQFGRIFEMKTETLPPIVLLSYTANDLCDVRVFEKSTEEWAAGFKEALRKTWADARPFLRAHPRGTRVLVLAPLDVVNVIRNPEILAQAVNVEGQGQITCGQLRHGETHLSVSSFLIMRMLNLMCPSVTQTHPGDTEHLEKLAAVQRAFGEAWKEQIAELNAAYADKKLSWSYLEGVRDLKFTTGDVGNDCFHPSVRGHAKLAELILSALRPGG
jgi:hypothetical protein